MKDFSLAIYRRFLESLIQQGYSFVTFNEFKSATKERTVCLRHDVDLLPANSLKFAKIQKEYDIRGTYFFRIVPESFDRQIIHEIHQLGHEIGYHYEDLSLHDVCRSDKKNKNSTPDQASMVEKGIISFEANLIQLREIAPVSTICMHGSPMSPYDSKLLWKYYDYREFGISAEPYFDLDFSKILYLTDTGRRWNGDKVSIRDKLISGDQRSKELFTDWTISPPYNSSMNMSKEATVFQDRYSFNSTTKIIESINNNDLPDQIMFTFHPQRWTDRTYPWIKELIWQNIKNVAKYFLNKLRTGNKL